MTIRKIFLLTPLLFAAAVAVAMGKYSMRYEVAFDRTHHYLDVTMHAVFEEPVEEPVTLEMPVWAPGYYIIVDFPKNLSDFEASDADGNAFEWRKASKNRWMVAMEGQKLDVRYRVAANDRSVAESRVDSVSAFIAPNGVFMYFDGEVKHPVDVTFVMPKEWKNASTGMKPVGENKGMRRTFHAPDFDVLFDSPLLFGNHYVKQFEFEGHDYEFALETPDGFGESGFEGDFKRMVSAATKLIGDVPYDNYCMIHLGAGGGGLEHLNSQACYTKGSYRFDSRNDYLGHLCFVTHEYFHLYNVKAIRPYELGPFDYSRECYTPLLWVSEGFTCYYEGRILRQAGIVDGDYLLHKWSASIHTVQKREGRKHMSLWRSSYDIWLNFFGHNENTISYYDKGPVVALLFDIRLRDMTDGALGLDDVMRLLYSRYYKAMRRGFTEEEFWQTAEEVAGGSLADIRRYVDTTDEIDYEKCLAPAGLTVDTASWTLSRIPNPTKRQIKLRETIL